MLRLILVVVAPLLVTCGRPDRQAAAIPWVPEALPELGAVVARVGEVPIHAAEVAVQARRSGKGAREALDELIAFHALAERVRAAWPPEDEAARTLHRQVLVQRLLERDLEPRVRPEDLPDAEVRKIYDGSLDKFVHGRRVEVAVLQVTVGRKGTPELRAQSKETATALAALVEKRKERTFEDFQKIATDREWSDRRVKYYRFMQEQDRPYSAVFGAAVQRLKKPGETTPLIEDFFGFYIARYISEVAPRNVSFEQVRQELRDGYYQRWRKMQFDELSNQAAARHRVEINLTPLTATAQN